MFAVINMIIITRAIFAAILYIASILSCHLYRYELPEGTMDFIAQQPLHRCITVT